MYRTLSYSWDSKCHSVAIATPIIYLSDEHFIQIFHAVLIYLVPELIIFKSIIGNFTDLNFSTKCREGSAGPFTCYPRNKQIMN